MSPLRSTDQGWVQSFLLCNGYLCYRDLRIALLVFPPANQQSAATVLSRELPGGRGDVIATRHLVPANHRKG